MFYDTGAETTPEEDLWAMLGSSNFKPSLKNTVLFLYSMVNSTTIFLVNSTGRPFKQGLMDKKGLVYLTIGLYGVAGALALEAVPGLSQWMQLVAFPSSEFALAAISIRSAVIFIPIDLCCFMGRFLSRADASLPIPLS